MYRIIIIIIIFKGIFRQNNDLNLQLELQTPTPPRCLVSVPCLGALSVPRLPLSRCLVSVPCLPLSRCLVSVLPLPQCLPRCPLSVPSSPRLSRGLLSPFPQSHSTWSSTSQTPGDVSSPPRLLPRVPSTPAHPLRMLCRSPHSSRKPFLNCSSDRTPPTVM